VVERLPSELKALGSVPSSEKKEKRKKIIMENKHQVPPLAKKPFES